MSNALTNKTIEKVMVVVRERYDKKGANFIFKARQLDVPNMSSQVVGQCLAEATKRGYPMSYYKRSESRLNIWQSTYWCATMRIK